MTVSFTGNLKVLSSWTYTNTDTLSQETNDKNTRTLSQSLTSGTGSQQANRMYKAQRSITLASPSDNLDMAGSLTDVFGQTLTFTSIRRIEIYNLSETSGDYLLIGGHATAGISSIFNGSATPQVKIGPLGCWVVSSPINGFAVTAGSADILRLENVGTQTISYDIIVIGVGS